MEEDKKWTHERKKLLVAARLRHELDFKGKKKARNTVWETILREMKEVDSEFPFSRNEITRTFVNIMGTYKRIKKRNNTSGEGATKSEFFDDMDKVFGSRSCIDVPLEMTECTLDSEESSMLDSSALEDAEGEEPVMTGKAKKRKQNEVLGFLKLESEKDQEKLNKLVKLETEKLEVEKQKVSELKSLRALFETFSKESHKN